MEICNKCGSAMLLVSSGDGSYYSCHNCGEISFTYIPKSIDDDNKNFTLPLKGN